MIRSYTDSVVFSCRPSVSFFTNFAFSFNIISILTGVTTLFAVGLSYGGPATLIYGWLVVGFFTSVVAASMAEICSAYPTSGGLSVPPSPPHGPTLLESLFMSVFLS